jgi:hypothetical protein
MELFIDNKKNVAVCRCRHGHLKIQNNSRLSAATLGLKRLDNKGYCSMW